MAKQEKRPCFGNWRDDMMSCAYCEHTKECIAKTRGEKPKRKKPKQELKAEAGLVLEYITVTLEVEWTTPSGKPGKGPVTFFFLLHSQRITHAESPKHPHMGSGFFRQHFSSKELSRITKTVKLIAERTFQGLPDSYKYKRKKGKWVKVE